MTNYPLCAEENCRLHRYYWENSRQKSEGREVDWQTWRSSRGHAQKIGKGRDKEINLHPENHEFIGIIVVNFLETKLSSHIYFFLCFFLLAPLIRT